MARALQGSRDHALMLSAGTGALGRQNLRVRAHEPANELCVLVVDEGNLLAAEQAGFAGVISWCWHRFS